MLGFHEDALLLSGPAGTGLKTRILGNYYEFWWRITSGGESKRNEFPTAIVDMNAGSGELYIKELGEHSSAQLGTRCGSSSISAILRMPSSLRSSRKTL